MPPLILHIDTATDNGSVSLALGGTVLQERVNQLPVDHAAWVHTAVIELMATTPGDYQLADLNAIAVVAGPGSYTGLRVGMATAKGLCYALNIPLISLNTLKIMAYATNKEFSSSLLLCPMLDARRMEVFTALYDAQLHELIQPCAMVLDENSFSRWLAQHQIIFSGNGSHKWRTLVQHEQAVFSDTLYTPGDIARLAHDSFMGEAFADMAYAEPFYLKDFYSPQKQ